MNQLAYLQRKLKEVNNAFQEQKSFFEDAICKGYLKRPTKAQEFDKTWYVFYHDTEEHPNTQGKVKTVIDWITELKIKSISYEVMCEPDLMNQIILAFVWFSKEESAFMVDALPFDQSHLRIYLRLMLFFYIDILLYIHLNNIKTTSSGTNILGVPGKNIKRNF